MQAIFQFYGTYRPEVKGSPLTDVRVREALSLAVDRQQIIKHVMDGQAHWPMPLATFRYSIDMDVPRWESWAKEAFRYDPERAKKLLAEAGYPNGFNLTFWNTALPGTPFMIQIGEAVAGFWEKIGVKVDLKPVEWGAFPPWSVRIKRIWSARHRCTEPPAAPSLWPAITAVSIVRASSIC
jgi:peptide/nickel transport system substrate-binding protein